MPSRHRYKCLNPDCPSLLSKARSLTFITMNSPQPTCPMCGCIKLEDWGEAVEMNVGSGSVKRIDNTLNGLAKSYGMTDITNKDGGPAKTHKIPEQGKYGTKNYFGVDVPIGDKPVTVHGSSAYTAFKVEAGTKKLPGNRAIPTQVTAAHKGTP